MIDANTRTNFFRPCVDVYSEKHNSNNIEEIVWMCLSKSIASIELDMLRRVNKSIKHIKYLNLYIFFVFWCF